MVGPNETWETGFPMEDEEAFPPPLPEMQYKARCDDITRKEGRGGGFFNFFWKMVITEGEHANKSLNGVTHLKPETKHIGFIRACAALRPDIMLKGTKFKPADYIGRTCIIDVKTRTFTSQAGNEVSMSGIDDWLPLETGAKAAQPSAAKTEGSGEVDATTFDK